MAWRVVDYLIGTAMASVVAWAPLPTAKISFTGNASGLSLISFTGECESCAEGEVSYDIGDTVGCAGTVRVDLWKLSTGSKGRDEDMQKVLAGSDRWKNRYATLDFSMDMKRDRGRFNGQLSMNGKKKDIKGWAQVPCGLSWEMDMREWGYEPPKKDLGVGVLAMDPVVKVNAKVGRY